MNDREKVSRGLELLAHWPDGLIITDKEKWIKPCCEMAIALLKEHEPVRPTWLQGKAYCSSCGRGFPRKSADREINYCSYCGRAVKFE